MKALSANAEKFINKVVATIVELTPDPERTGAVIALLDTRDGPEAFPLTLEVGTMKPEKRHKYSFCAIEKSLRLLENGAHRSFDYAEAGRHQYGGGVRLGEYKIGAISGFDPFVDEAGSVVIDAYLQAEEEDKYGDEVSFLARCRELVDEFVEQAGAKDNVHIADFTKYFLN